MYPSEAQVRNMIDTIPALAWCNLPDGSNEFLNKRWHDYTGLSPEESGGSGWQTVIHPQDLPRMMEKWQEVLTSGEAGEGEARTMARFGGFFFAPSRYATRPVRSSGGTAPARISRIVGRRNRSCGKCSKKSAGQRLIAAGPSTRFRRLFRAFGQTVRTNA